MSKADRTPGKPGHHLSGGVRVRPATFRAVRVPARSDCRRPSRNHRPWSALVKGNAAVAHVQQLPGKWMILGVRRNAHHLLSLKSVRTTFVMRWPSATRPPQAGALPWARSSDWIDSPSSAVSPFANVPSFDVDMITRAFDGWGTGSSRASNCRRRAGRDCPRCPRCPGCP